MFNYCRLLLHESFHKRLAFVLAVCVRAHRKKVSLNSPQSSEVLRRSPRPRKRERANLLLGWQSREGNASWQTRGLEMPARQREKFPSLQGIGGSSHLLLTSARVRARGVERNQVHSITVQRLGIPNPDFQPILTMEKFYSKIVLP